MRRCLPVTNTRTSPDRAEYISNAFPHLWRRLTEFLCPGYADIGRPSHNTITMVHGWPSVWSTWSKQIEVLKVNRRKQLGCSVGNRSWLVAESVSSLGSRFAWFRVFFSPG